MTMKLTCNTFHIHTNIVVILFTIHPHTYIMYTCMYMYIYIVHISMKCNSRSLVVKSVPLVSVEDEELVSAIGGEHLEGTVSQEVAPLVYLPHNRIRPLYTPEVSGEGVCTVWMYVYRCSIWPRSVKQQSVVRPVIGQGSLHRKNKSGTP